MMSTFLAIAKLIFVILNIIVDISIFGMAVFYGYKYVSGKRSKENFGTLTHNFRMFVVCMLLYLM